MRKRQLLCCAVIAGSIGMLAGCGVFSKNDTEQETTSIIAESITSQQDESSSTAEEETTETVERETFEGDVSTISNEKVTWGVGVHILDDHRPVAPVQLQEQYGSKYAVDFVRENEKNIYLTFDEGYENGYTASILDTLKEKNVKAVFFITMPYAKSEQELIRRMIDEGHVVGSHSVTHPTGGMPSLSVEDQMKEYQELHTYIQENFGYDMYLFRPPAGIFSEQSLAIAQKCGYRSVMWSFAYNDWDPDNQMEVSKALENAVNKVHNGAIYLLHAVSKTNTEMLGQFIDQVQTKGYEFKIYK